MTATAGRYRRFSVLVATGNGQGACGLGKAKAISLMAAVRRAKQRASRNIITFNVKDNRTLWHIGYLHEWHSKITARPEIEGHGLRCHRLIRTICQLIGIKDMYAKVEGSTRNYQVIARGFLRLLSEQETYADLANRIGLHVVEFSSDCDMVPKLLASPAPGCSIDPRQQRGDDSTVATNPLMGSSFDDDHRPILAISHPDRRRPRKPLPFNWTTFLDELVYREEGEERASTTTTIHQLLAQGERDLNSLKLDGRVLNVKQGVVSGKPGYLKNPGNMKRQAERHRYRNHDAVLIQRQAYEALDASS